MRLMRLALAAVLAATTPGLSRAGQATAAPQAQVQAPDPAGRAAAAKAEAARAQAELAFLRAAAQAVAHGRRGEAEALARARGDRDEAGAAVLARLAADRGEFDAAAALAAPASAAAPTGNAALEWGLILFQQGKKAEARRVLAPVAAGSRSASTADGLLRVARAARALGQVRTANALFREAVAAAGAAKDAGLVAAANTAWGELFLDTHDARQRRGLVSARRSPPTAHGRRPTPGSRGPWRTRTRRPPRRPRSAPSRSTRRWSTRTCSSPARPSTPTNPPRRRNTSRAPSPPIRTAPRRMRSPPPLTTSLAARPATTPPSRRPSPSIRRTATSSASWPPTRRATTGMRMRSSWPGRPWRSSPTTRGRRRPSGFTCCASATNAARGGRSKPRSAPTPTTWSPTTSCRCSIRSTPSCRFRRGPSPSSSIQTRRRRCGITPCRWSTTPWRR